MNPISFLERLVRLSACLCALLCWSAPTLVAQQSTSTAGQEVKPTTELDTRQIDLVMEDQPLAAIIEALTDQIGHGIVVDGKPLETRGSFKLHTTAKAALDQVAEHFDCIWTVGKHGAILMSKQFHEPGDLPQLHLKEMQKMAADIAAIWPENAGKARLSGYPFITVAISPGNALYRTFTSDQLKDLNDGKSLTFQDLSGDQQKLVRLGIYNNVVGTSHDVWEGLNARLAKMPSSYLQWRSLFHNQLDAHPTPFQYSLEYVWPDLQDRGFDRLVTARQISEATGAKAK